jgi:hypothetical protein
MKKILDISEFLKEALSLNVAKQYVKMGENRSEEVQKKLNQMFDGKQRLYFPVENEKFFIKSNVYWKISNILQRWMYSMDYIDGYAWHKDKPKNKTRILKVLTKLSLTDSEIKDDLAEISKEYINDPARDLKNSKTNMVVISQHPYDIAGMSTGRGWTSCMNLDTGCNRGYVEEDIQYGSFVAYFTNSNDKNIEKPFGRLLIKPYFSSGSQSDEISFENDDLDFEDVYYLPNPTSYGSFTSNGESIVSNWLNEKQGLISRGYYSLPTELYADSGSPRGFYYSRNDSSAGDYSELYLDGGYDEDGYNEDGYNDEGYDRDGYDEDGYNEDGYDEYGYDKWGYNEDGYDSDGYNSDGYDEYGYNEDGYDENGLDRDGNEE